MVFHREGRSRVAPPKPNRNYANLLVFRNKRGALFKMTPEVPERSGSIGCGYARYCAFSLIKPLAVKQGNRHRGPAREIIFNYSLWFGWCACDDRHPQMFRVPAASAVGSHGGCRCCYRGGYIGDHLAVALSVHRVTAIIVAVAGGRRLGRLKFGYF